MILDNEKYRKVHEWIKKYTEEGTVDIVTGYFTVGALADLSQEINHKIAKFRLVLGDIVNLDQVENRPLDLLNENITIEAALNLSILAQEAVMFLKQDKVKAKTLEPNFCHAKCYLFEPFKDDDRNKYFISGSSNLTEAGIGLKHTNNLELNIAETGNNHQYKELEKWFDSLWHKPQAHQEKTLLFKDGTTKKVDFKQYLIQEIEKIFIKYTPRDIYYKILFELFGNQVLEIENDPDFNRQVGRLENTSIFTALYDFQKKGVLSLIRMLQKYDGAILADAVGLGKTWSALAVMKFFQMQGREVILLCPKKLESNWRRYKEDQASKFETDKLKFFIRFHTDMNSDRLNSYNDRADKFFCDDKPKLIVIDESHNLRNDKSNRYKFLVDNILKKNQDIKVLLISATPINNSLNDVRNQFKLMVQGDVHGYDAKLGVRNIDYSFKQAQTIFNEWRRDAKPQIGNFIKKLSDNDFFRLTDSLLVARTRKMVEGQQTNLVFPTKTKPKNLFVTPHQLGNFETFEELFDHFPPMLSGYQPAFYWDDESDNKKDAKKDILRDEKSRDRFLVKMIYILMVKRLESSWFSFYSTVEKIKNHHQNALDKIKSYQANKVKTVLLENDVDDLENDENDDDFPEAVEQYTLGKKRQISIAEIDQAGNLDKFKEDLKKDLDALDKLSVNLQKFHIKIDKEIKKPNQFKSCDDKLEKLIEEIIKKRKSGVNNHNQKVVIFTVYRDTAMYLFNQLRARGFDKMAIASGTDSYSDDSQHKQKMEAILERFAPYTKLFCEKEWSFNSEKQGLEAFAEWQEWVRDNHPETYQKLNNPIDILIATDALSEGQNLQDADMVINYDIHWNPVRIIQRMGRIDRLGSPNQQIFGINFWPSDNINSYLNLQGRIEQRMAAMKLAGAEVDHQFSDSFAKMVHDEEFDQKMNDLMMQQMQVTWDDIEVSEQGLGFDSLSLERYRQDLLAEFNRDKDKYRQMPKGVYTGFAAERKSGASDDLSDGIIALLGYPAKPAKKLDHQYQVFDLIYIDKSGKLILKNQKEVLDLLTLYKEKERFVPDAIDHGEAVVIAELVNALKTWLSSQAVQTEEMEDGSIKETMGNETLGILQGLKKGNKASISRIKQNVTVDGKYQLNNFDLISWVLVTV
ncbi:phospholipase D-like domain-containing protein [Dolichospermum sp. ST_con]|nr:phospholipase D-like domain-containing protein [Dolichospermum sp. ST_con]MDD1418862.1 phospholipase D-like domain-containing protein [Dolichospermum sp. ST_sed1]MDD1424666.1 phospholipase D-like domain-containing protein [Dolichospermum sp. ST_sed9]MDD1430192.1 phospholipase D-like domain-containing protein [Dolichospermum sp. ST_sed6]MDD1439888.1 phospholipase D-like domain-containing protein [Dolichospermum sp. ST_sed3]MDD1446547.1 phospholipase D-like domain-containing protein [Dolichos